MLFYIREVTNVDTCIYKAMQKGTCTKKQQFQVRGEYERTRYEDKQLMNALKHLMWPGATQPSESIALLQQSKATDGLEFAT